LSVDREDTMLRAFLASLILITLDDRFHESCHFGGFIPVF
jgi:hypothetical protein